MQIRARSSFGGIPAEEHKIIAGSTGFPLGTFPVRYLGMPLMSGKLSKTDCQVLVEKITTRIRGWNSKSLSYDGRIQLISSVISSVLQYWMSVFLLPQSVLKGFEAICNMFLWGVVNNGTRAKALVAWEYVVALKAERVVLE
ncbi:unnamed protein product [Linum trigynum]|uniref:Reverse transcriptase n=1 Tax=Linum trigynum TaxID=586398 RepID=A0AAV2EA11_9ROSI